MIERLIIDNFRSIKHLDIPLGRINSFIGPNSSGKTNILTALNIVLREVYPSIRIFQDSDFFNYGNDPIEIKVIFDTPLSTKPYYADRDISGFSAKYDKNDFYYYAIDHNGDYVLHNRYGNEIRVTNDMRNEVPLMHIGINRQASNQLRPTQWTIYGKILKHINTMIDPAIKTKYETEVSTAYENNIRQYLNDFQDIMKKFTKEHTGLNVEFNFSVLNPTEVLKSFRPFVVDDTLNKSFDLENVGLGVQSALAIALARAYGEIVKRPLILSIEEPELFLHPHACRHFFKILQQLSESGFQIFFSTHSRCFVDIINYNFIHLVRKAKSETYVKSGLGLGITADESLKLSTMCDDRVNEIFFADKVVLVEGFTDQTCCHCALETQDAHIDENNISIIECGGKDEIIYLASLMNHFDVECYTIFDEDPGNPDTLANINEARTLLGPDQVLIQSPNLEGMLRIPRKWNKKESLNEAPEWFKQNPMPPMYNSLKIKLIGS